GPPREAVAQPPTEVEVEDGGEVGVGQKVSWAGLKEIRRGEVWRLLTPIFVHFGALPLAFNAYLLFELAGLVELRRGPLWLASLVVAIGVVANVGQFAHAHNPHFGGMSGVVFGLVGYVWVKSRYNAEGGMYLRPRTLSVAALEILYSMAGGVGAFANVAPAVG